MLSFAAFVAGADMASSDLKSGATDVAAATTELVVGASKGSTAGWGAMITEELTASVGTKLVFKWGDGHNVVMTDKDAWSACDREGVRAWGAPVCLATDADSAKGVCEGGDEKTKGMDNKYTYEAVASAVGEYYFICAVRGHCEMGQKVKVTVTEGTTAAPAETVASPPPASSSPPPAESSEDSAAASLGNGALGTVLFVTATAALLRGLAF